MKNVWIWIGVVLAAFLLFGKQLRGMFSRVSPTGTRTVPPATLQRQTPDLGTLAGIAAGGLARAFSGSVPYNETGLPVDNSPSVPFGDFGGNVGADVGIGTNPTVFDNMPSFDIG